MGRLPVRLPPGIPSESAYVSWYCDERGIPVPAPADWAFFTALSLFRAAAILAGVYTRALAGSASSSGARTAAAPSVVRALADTALRLVRAAPGTPFAATAASGTAQPPPLPPPPQLLANANAPLSASGTSMWQPLGIPRAVPLCTHAS